MQVVKFWKWKHDVQKQIDTMLLRLPVFYVLGDNTYLLHGTESFLRS